MLRLAFVVVHAEPPRCGMGGMTYSLGVVQPRAARFFADDDDKAYERFTNANAPPASRPGRRPP